MVHAVEVLVVVADRVRLGLVVAQLVDGLHLRRDAGAFAGELAAHMGEAAVCVVLQRRHALDEQLERVDVARVGHAELAVVLREGLDDGVELLLLLALVLPVGVHGQAERVLPLVPVVQLSLIHI